MLAAVGSYSRAQETSDGEQKKQNQPIVATSPQEAGPDFAFQGEYSGVIYGGYHHRPVGMQVVAEGNGKFKAVLLPGGLPGEGDNGGERKEFSAVRQGDIVLIGADPSKVWMILGGECWIMHGETLALEAVLKKRERTSPTLGAPPPPDAIILFDGSSAEEWQNAKVTEDGLLMEGPITRRSVGDFTLHLEFRLPFMPAARGQGRANSGVYIQRRYEVQILDSFGLAGAANECGGLYRQRPPDVNMCLPPLSWQTYDIDFRAARFDEAGNKTENARITVRHNGVPIHDNVSIKSKTGAGQAEAPQPLPILLQNHGNPVRFKNVWIIEPQQGAAN